MYIFIDDFNYSELLKIVEDKKINDRDVYVFGFLCCDDDFALQNICQKLKKIKLIFSLSNINKTNWKKDQEKKKNPDKVFQYDYWRLQELEEWLQKKYFDKEYDEKVNDLLTSEGIDFYLLKTTKKDIIKNLKLKQNFTEKQFKQLLLTQIKYYFSHFLNYILIKKQSSENTIINIICDEHSMFNKTKEKQFQMELLKNSALFSVVKKRKPEWTFSKMKRFFEDSKRYYALLSDFESDVRDFFFYNVHFFSADSRSFQGIQIIDLFVKFYKRYVWKNKGKKIKSDFSLINDFFSKEQKYKIITLSELMKYNFSSINKI